MDFEQISLHDGDLLLPLITEYKPQSVFMQDGQCIFLDISIHSGMYSTSILIFLPGESFGSINFRWNVNTSLDNFLKV